MAAPSASGHRSAMESRISRWLSSTPKVRAFFTFVPMATCTASKVIKALPMMSRWPRVIGSNDPAYRALVSPDLRMDVLSHRGQGRGAGLAHGQGEDGAGALARRAAPVDRK